MPYKDRGVQIESQRQHYRDNKEDYKARNRRRRKERRVWFDTVVMVGRECSRCSENDPACLDFHHLEPHERKDGVARLLTDLSNRKLILREIEKCIVLCSNCHRKEHRDLRGIA